MIAVKYITQWLHQSGYWVVISWKSVVLNWSPNSTTTWGYDSVSHICSWFTCKIWKRKRAEINFEIIHLFLKSRIISVFKIMTNLSCHIYISEWKNIKIKSIAIIVNLFFWKNIYSRFIDGYLSPYIL